MKFLIFTNQTNSNELHEGDVASATVRAVEKLKGACMAKWCEIRAIVPIKHGEDIQEFVNRIPQMEEI